MQTELNSRSDCIRKKSVRRDYAPGCAGYAPEVFAAMYQRRDPKPTERTDTYEQIIITQIDRRHTGVCEKNDRRDIQRYIAISISTRIQLTKSHIPISRYLLRRSSFFADTGMAICKKPQTKSREISLRGPGLCTHYLRPQMFLLGPYVLIVAYFPPRVIPYVVVFAYVNISRSIQIRLFSHIIRVGALIVQYRSQCCLLSCFPQLEHHLSELVMTLCVEWLISWPLSRIQYTTIVCCI